MGTLLIPPRIRGEEILDRGNIDPKVLTKAIGDVALANALFGGVSAVMAELGRALPALPKNASLLDLGTGVGDIPRAASKMLRRHGIDLTTFGLDAAEPLAFTSKKGLTAAVCADALRLPFKDKTVDVVMCSQFLHHMLPDDATRLIREMDRVARVRVIISDIRRSWFAAAGLWMVSFPLGFHPISRHDGVVSVMRGFRSTELKAIVTAALGVDPTAAHRPGFRVTASWTPRA